MFHRTDFTFGENAARYFEELNGNIMILKMTWHRNKRWNYRNAKVKNGLIFLEEVVQDQDW